MPAIFTSESPRERSGKSIVDRLSRRFHNFETTGLRQACRVHVPTYHAVIRGCTGGTRWKGAIPPSWYDKNTSWTWGHMSPSEGQTGISSLPQIPQSVYRCTNLLHPCLTPQSVLYLMAVTAHICDPSTQKCRQDRHQPLLHRGPHCTPSRVPCHSPPILSQQRPSHASLLK